MDERELCVRLDLDAEGLDQLSGLEAVTYAEVVLWGDRQNHLSVYRGEPARWDTDMGRRAVWDLPLRCVPHPHPECRFRYVSLAVDLRHDPDGADQPDVRVEDFSPQLIEGADPVRLVTKRAGELKFALTRLDANAGVSAEETREVQVHYPVVRGSRQDHGLVVWTFEPLTATLPLHADQPLRVLLSAPAARVGGLAVRVRVEARVQLAGVVGLFPLVGRRTVRLDEWHGIDGIG